MSQKKRQLAIIDSVQISPGRGRAAGQTICELQMIIMIGEERGQRIVKRYYFDRDLPDVLKQDFLRLGMLASEIGDLERSKSELVGRIARLALVTDEDGKLRIFVEDYIGSDDPRKYYPQKR